MAKSSRGIISTVVRGWKPPHLILADPPEPDSLKKPLEGVRFRLEYLRDGIFHSFETESLGQMKVSEEVSFWGLRYPRRINSRNLRSFPRIKTRISAQAFDASGKSWDGVIRDLSQSGCRMEIPQANIDLGDLMLLSFVLPNGMPFSEAHCVIRQTYGGRMYGVEFEKLDETNQEALEAFLRISSLFQSEEIGSEATRGMQGDIEIVSLPDLFQILTKSRRAYVVAFRRGPFWGLVQVKDGEVWRAETASSNGVEAIFELLSWRNGRYHIQTAGELEERNVHAPIEYLLLEFAHRLDSRAMAGDEILLLDSEVTG